MKNGLLLYAQMQNDRVVQTLHNGYEKEAMGNLAAYAEKNGVSGNVLKQYLAYLIACDDNIFSYTVELNGSCGSSLMKLAEEDFGALLKFYTNYEALLDSYVPTCPAKPEGFYKSVRDIAQVFGGGPKAVLHEAVRHYREYGRSVAARYIALEWKKGLSGIETFDQISFEELIGIEGQKETLKLNTERFLQGKGANNILLFGDSGTGKSSCVKALLSEYHNKGLRLVELKKTQLTELEDVFKTLRQSRYRYIIFMDDLSFEEGDLGYKNLKAALEGKATQVPQNVLFYATSNRRHLIKETWADRVAEREEVHISDTMHEKLSLSERFGLTVYFMSPGQEEYLAIVRELCKTHHIAYNGDIQNKALQWAFQHGARSGRAAKQFVISMA